MIVAVAPVVVIVTAVVVVSSPWYFPSGTSSP